MSRSLPILLLCLLLSSCAAIDAVRPVAESTDVFAVCKAGDVLTTAYAIRTGMFIEKNPLVAPLISHGYLPLIAISIGIWYLLDRYNNPAATIAANVVTCPVAVHNLWLIAK